MSVLNKVLGLFLGNKYERDLKEIMPYVNFVKREYERLTELSADQLREESNRLREEIRDYIRDDEEEVSALRKKAEEESDISVKEDIYNDIDKKLKAVESRIEEILDKKLPLAFAIVKDTARRFKENQTIEVTARDYDRDLASARDSVVIKGEKAVWKNVWVAGGNDTIWDMVHYDVQLIGGVALHKGKIAEMGTGEGKLWLLLCPFFLMLWPGKVCISLLLTIILPEGIVSGWDLYTSFMDLLSIALINISLIPRKEGRHIMLILHLVPIMSLDSIICVIIWQGVVKT
jgi:preprotein translocase subunit SecA